jgi:hypothetical protein
VHVVNDLRVPIADGTVTATVTRPDAGPEATAGPDAGVAPNAGPEPLTWRFAGDVGADSCARVGVIRLPIPDQPGPLRLDLDLTWAGGKTHNQYLTHIDRLK